MSRRNDRDDMTEKPPNVYNRDVEWADLTGFVTAPGPRLRLGIVYGRRRFGKSHILRELVESVGGVYHLALQEESRTALDRFATTLSHHHPGAPPLRFDDWNAALGYAATMLGERRRGPQVLVLDEYPYLRQTSPELAALAEHATRALPSRHRGFLGDSRLADHLPEESVQLASPPRSTGT